MQAQNRWDLEFMNEAPASNILSLVSLEIFLY